MRDVRTLDHTGLRRPWALGGLLLCGLLSIAPFALAGCCARPSASRTRVEESGAQIRPAQLRLVQAKDGRASPRTETPRADRVAAYANAYLVPQSMRVLRDYAIKVRTDLISQVLQPGKFTSPERA